jgi:hypothetical protein
MIQSVDAVIHIKKQRIGEISLPEYGYHVAPVFGLKKEYKSYISPKDAVRFFYQLFPFGQFQPATATLYRIDIQ